MGARSSRKPGALSPVPVAPPEDWTGPLDLETADFEEWTDEEREPPIDVFRDDREPWEDIVLQELSELDLDEEEAAWASGSVGARSPKGPPAGDVFGSNARRDGKLTNPDNASSSTKGASARSRRLRGPGGPGGENVN